MLSIPAVSLLTLTLAAILSPFSQKYLSRSAPAEDFFFAPPGPASIPSIAVLVPAFNESHHAVPTITHLLEQVGPHGQIIVIADNCDDDTAARARQAGATVIERTDATSHGKGFALAFGVDYLRAAPPDVVVVIDADCFVTQGAIVAIACACQASGRPVQMPSLMHAGESAGLKFKIMEFAMRMKNFVRPMGSSQLGHVCHLMGTGMALPWNLISQARLATPNLVEDMVLGIDFALQGYPAVFFPDCQVTSDFVQNAEVVRVQKSRWEHGHLQVMRRCLPGLISNAWRRRDPALAVLAIDLSIPPVALYCLILSCVMGLTLLASLFWSVPFALIAILVLTACCFGLSVGVGWWYFGRHILSGKELLEAPRYMLWKLPIYLAFFFKRSVRWVRTDREDHK